jgi:hypothetical protein
METAESVSCSAVRIAGTSPAQRLSCPRLGGCFVGAVWLLTCESDMWLLICLCLLHPFLSPLCILVVGSSRTVTNIPYKHNSQQPHLIIVLPSEVSPVSGSNHGTGCARGCVVVRVVDICTGILAFLACNSDIGCPRFLSFSMNKGRVLDAQGMARHVHPHLR